MTTNYKRINELKILNNFTNNFLPIEILEYITKKEEEIFYRDKIERERKSLYIKKFNLEYNILEERLYREYRKYNNIEDFLINTIPKIPLLLLINNDDLGLFISLYKDKENLNRKEFKKDNIIFFFLEDIRDYLRYFVKDYKDLDYEGGNEDIDFFNKEINKKIRSNFNNLNFSNKDIWEEKNLERLGTINNTKNFIYREGLINFEIEYNRNIGRFFYSKVYYFNFNLEYKGYINYKYEIDEENFTFKIYEIIEDNLL